MVPTLYQDESSGKSSAPSSNGESVNSMKKTMTLDFNSAGSRPNKFQTMLAANSPSDMNMLKLASPEFEKILMQNGVMATTPTPTQFMYSKFVTDEQEAYARGFLVALDELHKEGPPTATSSSAASTYSTLQPISFATAPTTNTATVSSVGSGPPGAPSTASASTSESGSVHINRGVIQQPPRPVSTEYASSSSSAYSPVTVKEEPHTVPGSPPMSPINMEDQEHQKLERKRARNRIAARKCRTRKLERINRLEEKVADLKGTNQDLAQTANGLREQVHQLKQQIMDHVKSGCSIMMDPGSCMM